jgi:secreted trypsin-like serine protease
MALALPKGVRIIAAFFIFILGINAVAGIVRPSLLKLPGRSDVHKVVHKGQAVPDESDIWRFTVKVLDGEKLCTGAIIHPRFILTAGHCGAEMNPDKIEFYKGSSQVVASRSVKKIYVHPDYSAEGSDLALLEFEGGLPNDEYQPIEILNDLKMVPPHAEITATGFGLTSPQEYGILTWGTGRIVNQQEKSFGFDDDTNYYPCSGDSGGPAIFYHGKTPLLIGIAWLGYSLCDDSGGGGDYTSVPYFSNWIHGVVNSLGYSLNHYVEP